MAVLLFYKGTKAENPRATLLDRVICLVTASRFSHIELSLGDDGRFHRCVSSSTRDGGVRYTTIDTASGHWLIENTSRVADISWLDKQKGLPYDYIGLLGTVTGLSIFNSAGKWFCSELLAEALDIDKPYTQTPESIYRIIQRDLGGSP